MSVINPPGYMHNLATHSAQVDRIASVAATGAPDSNGLTWRGGVRGPTDMMVTAQATPNMTVAVAAGLAMVKGTENSFQSLYSVPNDGSVNVTISAANATLARRDLIVVRIQDSFYSGSNNLATIEVVTGTAAASPSDPSTPPNCLILARVSVAAAVTSINSGAIADLRSFSSALGGTILALNFASLPATSTLWQRARAIDTGLEYVWSGTAWSPVSNKTLTYASATTTVQSGDAGPKTLTGASRTIVIGATTDVVYVTIEVDWSNSASTIAYLSPQVDGAAFAGTSAFAFNSPAGRFPFTKSWRITGLSVGSHTITGSIQWAAGGSLDIVGGGSTTCLIVEHRSS